MRNAITERSLFLNRILFSTLILLSSFAKADEPQEVEVYHLNVNPENGVRMVGEKSVFSLSKGERHLLGFVEPSKYSKTINGVSDLRLPFDWRKDIYLSGFDLEVLQNIRKGIGNGLITGIAFADGDIINSDGRWVHHVDSSSEFRVRVNFVDEKGQAQVAWLKMNRLVDLKALDKLNKNEFLVSGADKMIQLPNGLWVHQDSIAAEKVFGQYEARKLEILREHEKEMAEEPVESGKPVYYQHGDHRILVD